MRDFHTAEQFQTASSGSESAAGASLGDFAISLMMARQPISSPAGDTTIEQFRKRLDNQNQTEKEPGLDPIIAKGQSLVRDLDNSLRTSQNKSFRDEIVKMRVTAGLNLCGAYTNCYGTDTGVRAFQPETLQELKNLMMVSPDVVQNKSFTELAYKVKTDAPFQKAFQAAGGDVEQLRALGQLSKADVAEILKEVSNGKTGEKFQSAVRAAYRAGETREKGTAITEVGSLINPINDLLKEQKSDYVLRACVVEANEEKRGLELVGVAKGDHAFVNLVTEYLRNKDSHTANTKDKLFEIMPK